MNPLSSFRRGARRGALQGALVALGALTGCGSDLVSETVDLAGLADRTLTYALNDVDVVERTSPPGSHRFSVLFSLADGERCTQLREGATATFNNKPMQLEPGGVDGTAGRDVCVPTRAFLDFEPSVWLSVGRQDARVVLADGSGTTTLVLQGGQAKRLFEYQGVGFPDRLLRGEAYTYRWTPPEETPGSLVVTLLREGGTAAANLPITQDGPNVTFTIPANTGVGDHLLTLSGTAAGVVAECVGVTACEGSLFHSGERVVNIQ